MSVPTATAPASVRLVASLLRAGAISVRAYVECVRYPAALSWSNGWTIARGLWSIKPGHRRADESTPSCVAEIVVGNDDEAGWETRGAERK